MKWILFRPRSSRELTRDVDTVANVDDQIRFTRKILVYALIHESDTQDAFYTNLVFYVSVVKN